MSTEGQRPWLVTYKINNWSIERKEIKRCVQKIRFPALWLLLLPHVPQTSTSILLQPAGPKWKPGELFRCSFLSGSKTQALLVGLTVTHSPSLPNCILHTLPLVNSSFEDSNTLPASRIPPPNSLLSTLEPLYSCAGFTATTHKLVGVSYLCHLFNGVHNSMWELGSRTDQHGCVPWDSSPHCLKI